MEFRFLSLPLPLVFSRRNVWGIESAVRTERNKTDGMNRKRTRGRCTHTHVYIYIYIYRKGKRERRRDKGTSRQVHTSTLKEKSLENGRPGRSMGARKMCTEIYITRNSIMPGLDTLGARRWWRWCLVSEYRTACFMIQNGALGEYVDSSYH